MIKKTVHIDFKTLEHFVTDVFSGLGVPDPDAAICADVVLEADRRGIDSHGINRLKPIYYDRIRNGIQLPETRIEVIRQGPTTALIDGNNGMGQVIAYRSMEMAIAKAKAFGMGMVAARNSTHYGIAGYYAMMAARKDMIGITGTNARPSIAPTFGVENMLGTNPLVFAMPTHEPFPFLIDCATSVTQRGKIEVYARENKAMPPGWVVTENGDTLTDANAALQALVDGTAALTPLGGIGEAGAGYKGYGYATVVEMLCAALQGGNYLKMLSGFENGKAVPYRLGHFFMALDISGFTDPESFKTTTTDILCRLRASRKAPGESRIYTAGEKEYEAWQARQKTGVPVNASLQEEIRVMTRELGLKGYDFPFPA